MKRINSANAQLAKKLFTSAIALHENKHLPQAKLTYQQVLKFIPNQPDALHMLGVIAFQENELDKAISLMTLALEKLPYNSTLFFNLGNAHRVAGDLDTAEKMYLSALQHSRSPDNLEIEKNLGNIYKEKNQLLKAIACYDQVLTTHPDHTYTLMNKAVALLTAENFAEGWSLYESRLDITSVNQTATPVFKLPPKWDGSSLNVKLLVLAEQGLGDQIFYASMFAELEKNSIEATVCLDERLIELFKRSFKSLEFIESTALNSRESLASSFSHHIYFGSLGRFFRRSKADFEAIRSPYLMANPKCTERIHSRLKSDNRIICGLTWDSKHAENGRTKRMPLADLLPVLQTPHIRFVDLQYGDTQYERQVLWDTHGVAITHFDDTDNFKDIDKVASTIQACDIVVTVSNSTAHLAAALGKPTLVMLPHHTPLWYWHLDSMSSPWYPSVTLLRQKKSGDWGSVIMQVSSILNGLIHPF